MLLFLDPRVKIDGGGPCGGGGVKVAELTTLINVLPSQIDFSLRRAKWSMNRRTSGVGGVGALAVCKVLVIPARNRPTGLQAYRPRAWARPHGSAETLDKFPELA